MLTPNSTLEPLPGSLAQVFKKCGDPKCACATGKQHGPYLTRVWYENGKRRKTYVRPKDAQRVRDAIELREIQRRADWFKKHLEKKISRRSRYFTERLLQEVEAEAAALRAKYGE